MNLTIKNCIIKGGYQGNYLRGATDSGETGYDIVGVLDVDPKLRDFGDYGGVLASPVAADSPAIGAGELTEEDLALMPTDAMGAARTVGACTIGAVEYNPNLVGVSLAEDALDPESEEGKLVARTGEVFASDYNFTLKANVTSDVSSYQWYKNGEAISGATGETFTTYQPESLAEYSVKVVWGSALEKTSVAKEVETSPNVAYSAWAATNLSGLSESQKAPDAILFYDGITNLERYAFAIPAFAPTSYANAAVCSFSGGSLSYKINALADDIIVKPFYSNNLIDWTEGSPTEISNDGTFIHYNFYKQPEIGKGLFLKLQVEKMK